MLAAAALLNGCSKEPAADKGPTQVILQTNWYAEPEFGGYYEAFAKGYYKQEGLDVRIVQGGPGAFPVQKVAVGQVQFAVARSDDLMMAAQEKLPVLMVSAQLEHDPQVVIVHAEGPVHGFKDLDGKTIMVEPGSAWITYLEHTYSIHIKTIPENYEIAQFIADKDFIQQGFLTAEPFVFGQMKIAVRSLLIADSGYDPYRVLFCNRAYARSRPEVVRAFVRASIRGWRDCLEKDPSAANTLIAKDYPANTPETLAFSWSQIRAAHIADGNAAKGERLGLLRRSRLEAQMAILIQLGMLKERIPLEDFVSFDYLPDDLRPLAEE
jgi:NitT/TauT family transport system substrate-binding protein